MNHLGMNLLKQSSDTTINVEKSFGRRRKRGQQGRFIQDHLSNASLMIIAAL